MSQTSGENLSTQTRATPLHGDPFTLTTDQTVALDLSANRVISASAGTGKTHTLTALYLGLLEGRLKPGGTLLSEAEWLFQARAGTLTWMNPGEIVAVTFTEKAAAELLERARGALERELARDDLPDALKQHLRQCRTELFGAPVSTIHAFCARLLREAGADGPVPAAFSVLEQDESEELFSAALSSAAAEMLESGAHPYLQKLAQESGVFTHRSGLIDTGRALLNALRTRGLQPGALSPVAAASLNEVQACLAAFYDALAAVPDKGRSKPKPELRALCAGRKVPQSLEEARLLALEIQPWLSGKWLETANLDDPCAFVLQAAHAPFAEALAAFAERARRNYTDAKRKAGGVDFDDLLLACRELLDVEKSTARAGEKSPLASRGYRFVLIDEYQDTNPLQRDVLFGVAFPGGDRSGSARVGVVGDIKQSIYRFRGADVTLMEEARRAFAPAPLRENFRSRKRVIEFFNAFFEYVWPGASGQEPRDTPFHYNAEHRLAHAGSVARHAWDGPAGEVIFWEKDDTGDAARHRNQQAFAAARRIRTLVAPTASGTLPRPVIWDKEAGAARDGVRYGDIAILSRSLKNIRVPLQIALSSLRVPFRILGGMSFFTRQEIIDVANLWAAASDPSDAFSVAGLLRSPFVGLSDAGLWQLSVRQESNTSLAQAVLDFAASGVNAAPGLSGDDAAALRRGAVLLTRFAEWLGRKTAVEILDWALTETGFLSVQALQPRGEIAVAAVRKAIELARGFEARGNRHLADWVRWLRERADAEWDDPGKKGGPDLSADLPEVEDAVQIGTIHSAKGLEFPIVFLTESGAASPPNNGWALYTPEHGLGLRIGSAFDGLKGGADAAHQANVAKAKRDEDAERLRLLYVALTRARDYVIILGETGRGGGETNWRRLLDTFLAANPDALTRIPAKHDELRAATAGAASGLLEFENGVARVRDDLAQQSADAAPNRTTHAAEEDNVPVPKRDDLRVSVSRLALWLWCPRRAAFAAWETGHTPSSFPKAANDVPTQDAEQAQSGVAEGARRNEGETGPDARALGTAAHAALETIFGAEISDAADVERSAADRFARELETENAPGDPEIRDVFEHVLRLARSKWGRKILALPDEDRRVETPFRWRIDVTSASAGSASVTLIGQLDLIAKTAPEHWQVVDYKLASLKDKTAESESVTRYAWQAGLYARVAAEILNTRAGNVDASLAFLRDDRPEPRSIEALGHGRVADGTLKRVATQFVQVSHQSAPLDMPAQIWLPAESEPKPRNAELCRAHQCPYVTRCFK